MRQLMQQRATDRWVSIVLSVLLHGAILGALVYGWLLYRRPPTAHPTLAIEATVINARTQQGVVNPPQPLQQSPPPESQGPPEPTPEELAQREQQRQQEEAAAKQKQQDAEQAAQQQAKEAEAQHAAEVKAAAEQAAEAQRVAEAKAAAERKAKAAAEAQKRAEAAQREADAQDAADRQADLKRSLAAETQANAAAAAGPALANWQAQIAARITRAWLRPPTARPGIECMLYVTQVPGGEVTQVRIGDCNGDQAVRESIEAAVYRASPLPPPPDPSLFDRNLKINFKPD
jgi:colicin import membrane protein